MALSHETGLTGQIIGLAMRVHTKLGPGLIESLYERCLCKEFQKHGIPCQRQVELPVIYDGQDLGAGYRADIVVGNEVLLELKSIEQIQFVHKAQLLTYLKLSTCRVGLLPNFNTAALKDGSFRRVL